MSTEFTKRMFVYARGYLHFQSTEAEQAWLENFAAHVARETLEEVVSMFIKVPHTLAEPCNSIACLEEDLCGIEIQPKPKSKRI